MAAIYSIDEANERGIISSASCSFGVFDGVHKGHRYVIDKSCEAAHADSCASVILTFDIDPDEMFAPEKVGKLMSNEDRIAMLASLGVDAVVTFPFTREFASQDPMTFLSTSFAGGLPSSLHVGSDFRFGAKAAGCMDDLEQWGSEVGVCVRGYELLSEEGEPVSSTRIRHLLGEGKIEEANELLGHRYFVCGEVQPGRGEGGDFGFRTANLHVPDVLKVLSDGVYAAYAYVDGRCYKAAVSNGVSPTFEGEARANLECHILDFDGDLYGKNIKVEFAHWLRPMMTFPSLDELIATVMGNISWVRENL